MNARWRDEFDQFSALRHLRDDDHAAMTAATTGHPMVAQTAEATSADRFLLDGTARPYSPDARLLPELSDAIDRARDLPTECCGVVGSFWYSNCGRRIQKDRNPAGPALSYDDRLKAITIEQWVEEYGPQARLELARHERDYDMAVEVAEYGGSPIKTVILYSPRGIGNKEYLVSQGWTSARVVRLATRSHRVPDCFFCPRVGVMSIFVKVDCGAVLRVFPMCYACEPRICRGFDPVRGGHHDLTIDVEFACDDWDQATGWPDDRFR
ncbi:hypothetical protein BJF87_07690 [Gordonia sp. CNJ-863]|uniref:hypothetical protein n=1 Tax=Gordonia sp. CNJ-863 TaxID=1904963 RepID=UPI00095FE12F|nr:hypothetical protein [Gordonia sp. CNJ-863]OLT44468.1 hypothetical protein BJF87_07690 [Gordonia sp. CNJ-863]